MTRCGFYSTTILQRPCGTGWWGIKWRQTYERGWSELTNGELLQTAELTGFDAMITTDQGIAHQQNLAGRKLALVILTTNDWRCIRKSTSIIVDAISAIRPGALLRIDIPMQ